MYFAEGVAEPRYYGIPCKPLPTISTLWLNQPIDVPNSINGPVLISASNLSGVEFGPGSLDPYGQFKLLKPTAVIDRGVFVFDGKFEMPLAAAISKVQKAQKLVQAKQLDQALEEAPRGSCVGARFNTHANGVGRYSARDGPTATGTREL